MPGPRMCFGVLESPFPPHMDGRVQRAEVGWACHSCHALNYAQRGSLQCQACGHVRCGAVPGQDEPTEAHTTPKGLIAVNPEDFDE